jgi:hypothetical protein
MAIVLITGSAISSAVSEVALAKPLRRPPTTPFVPPADAIMWSVAPAALKAGINTRQ